MRKRIVIDLGAPGGSAPQHRKVAGGKRRRWAKVLGILFGLFVVVIVAALIGGFIWWRNYQSTPTYTLTLMVDAAQRNDAAEFEKRIDSEEIAKNMVSSISEKAAGRYGLALSGPIQERINSVVPSLLPQMKQTIHDEVAKEIKGFASASEPRSFIFLLFTVPSLVKVTTEGDIAKATAAISNRQIELTMKRDAERWKVTEFKDDVVVQRIVDSVMKELPAIGSIDPKSPLLKQSPRNRRGRRGR
jgi:nitrate reductase NapE component